MMIGVSRLALHCITTPSLLLHSSVAFLSLPRPRLLQTHVFSPLFSSFLPPLLILLPPSLGCLYLVFPLYLFPFPKASDTLAGSLGCLQNDS